jgi:hypothetical protein
MRSLKRWRRWAPALGLAVAAMTLPGSASAICWIADEHPKSADLIPVADPRIAPLRRVAHRIHALVQANAAMHGLSGVRLRSRWHIGGAGGPARSLWYQARDHRPETWVGDCGVLEGADRLPARASIVVQVNATSVLFNGEPEINDEGLRAWREPPVVGTLQGRPLYHGWQVVLSGSGRPPWVHVTQAEFLAFAEREIARQQAGSGGHNPYWQAQLEALRRHRATLDAAALAAPARNAWVWQHPGVPAERYPLLVKLDPAFPWEPQHPQRVKLVALSIQGNGAQAEAMQRVAQTLDLDAFAALLD